MKVIIAGSRGITDMLLLETAIARSGFTITEVVSGKAQGVDTLGELWANNNNIPVSAFAAKWKIYGKKRAGKVRNLEMSEYGQALIAVWDGVESGNPSHDRSSNYA